MVNYAFSKIYKLTSPKTDKVYVGSTAQRLLCMRKAEHANDFRTFIKTGLRYCSSFEILKHGECKIELIKIFPCETKDELSAEEGKYIRELDCVNQKIAGRSQSEYIKDNYERIQEYSRKYRIEKKEMIKETRKKYNLEHKAKIDEYSRNYREKNIDYINEIITCECGCKVSRRGLSQHRKTAKHLKK